MADASVFKTDRLRTNYLPALPPKPNKSILSYHVATRHAPLTALQGIVVSGVQPHRYPDTPRHRVRKQVGSTNRWRLPQSLYSDLLGHTQAIRALHTPRYNKSAIHIMTAEGPNGTTNLDSRQSYQFRHTDDRPATSPDLKGPFRAMRLAPPPSAPGPLSRMRTFAPGSSRPVKPMEVFTYHSRKTRVPAAPDIQLECLGMTWSLHRPYLAKAAALAELTEGATSGSNAALDMMREPSSTTLEDFIRRSKFYGGEFEREQRQSRGSSRPTKPVVTIDTICFNIRDPMVTRHALAVALGHLYHDEVDIDVQDASGVMAAACALKFTRLIEGCQGVMLRNIESNTVAGYYKVAAKYHLEKLMCGTEHWLQCYLLYQVVDEMYLREIPQELLEKTLKSNTLFVPSEFHLFRCLAYWLFLQLNPDLQLMPTMATVIAYFNSLPKQTALLDREEAHRYRTLFNTLRLHGVTDTSVLADMQQMNILPQAELIEVLQGHYHSLQGGGDMFFPASEYLQHAVRQGFVLDIEPHFHSDVMSLHGFHFELRAQKSTKGVYMIYMQRLKPTDPMLSFRHTERHTFSMRPDRDVRYCIRAQTIHNGDFYTHSTGFVTHRFGFGDKTSKSQVLTLKDFKAPIFVTFSLVFPKS